MGQGIETLRLVERAAGVLAQREVRVSWPPPRLTIGPEWIDGDATPNKVARAFGAQLPGTPVTSSSSTKTAGSLYEAGCKAENLFI